MRVLQGWDQSKWGDDDNFPTKEDLDGAFPDNPLYLGRYDGHAIWVNSAALAVVPPVPEEDPPGGTVEREADGSPTGVFTDNAMALVSDYLPPPSPAQMAAALKSVLAEAAAAGVTSVTDMGAPDAWIDGALRDWAMAGNLTVRIESLRLAVDTEMGPGSDPRTAARYDPPIGPNATLSSRGVKFFLDGALGSWGAALLAPYSDKPDTSGVLRMTPADFAGNVSAWGDAGWQVATHAIGDRANRLALDTYEAYLAAGGADGGEQGDGDRRFRVEHSQIVDCGDAGRFAALGVVASMQPTHAMEDMAFAADRLGSDTGRLDCSYAPSTLAGFAGSLPIPFGSDFPVEPLDPRFGLYAAVTRSAFYPGDGHGQPSGGWYPAQCLSPLEALRGFTSAGGWARFDEARVGTLAPAMWADFLLLDTDVVDVADPEDLLSAAVIATFLGGRAVFGPGAAAAWGAAKAQPEGKLPVVPHWAVPEDGAPQVPGMWVVGRR